MRGIVVGGLLMTGPFWGFVAVLIGIWRTFALMEGERAPEPEELLQIAKASEIAMFAAAGAFVVGSIVVVWACFAIARNRASAVESAL